VGAAREPVPSFLPIGIGACLLGFSDTLVLYALATDDPPILGKTVACLGYAVLVSGLPASTTRDRTQFAERMEIRRVVTVGALITGGGLLVLLSLTHHPEVDLLSQILLGVFLAAMLLRDGVQATRSGVMLSNLRVQALLDPLTRLPNRRALAETLPRFDPEAGDVSVLTVDLDEFKAVNDLLGHSIGDRLLQAVGDELARIGQVWNANVYRMGGDEFAIVCSCSAEQAETLARSVVEGVDSAAGRVPGVSRIGVGASVGVRHLPAVEAASSVADGIVQSGHAMRAAKNAGKGRVHIFDDELQDAFRRRKLVELRLREQLAEVHLHFQPVVSVATGRVSAVEALARWEDPVLGTVEPEEFIEVAEYSGLIVDLGWRLLVLAVEQLASLSVLDDRLVMAVNVSAMQLRMPGFAKDVLSLLGDHGLATHRLLLEVTESVHVRADEPAGRAMAILSAAGVGMAIDDFGAGSTSVGYLAELPVSVIKIDRSLTAELPSPQATGIVRGVIEMSRGLGLRVVAEGIESLDQHELMRVLGVTFTQGWLYSRAVPPERVLATLDTLERRFAHVHR
jgi:diguanylate cyclase (GGDEF)-like protein